MNPSLLLSAVVAGLALAPSATAQIPAAPASPHARLVQQVGMAELTVDYSRPSARGREIFGGLLSYGKLWRTGANASTKLGFDRDVQFGGQDVPAGTYALYTIPERESWTIILHENTQLWGAGGYDEAQDLLRLEVPVTKLERHVETFTIDVADMHLNGGDLVLRWADVEVAVPIFVDSDAATFAAIEERVVNAEGEVSAQDFFSAAVFYHAKDHELDQAAAWMDNAIAQQPQAFWMLLARAELALDMGDLERAERDAREARRLAAASPAGDFGYVAKSDLLLARIEDAQEG